jgi:pimeloyl-ACP methyl ester carboxylesterase
MEIVGDMSGMKLPGLPEQLSWCVDGLTIAGMAWGPQDGQPVLALHGWLDNSASFEVLAPMLEGCRVVALDLTGHGLSDHRSQDATYLIWDDIPQVLKVIDQLGWTDCTILGHSRGAMIATLLAAAMPEHVRSLITLDGLVPDPHEDTEFVHQMRDSLRYTARLATRAQRHFSSVEDFIERRQRYGVTPEIAARFAARALEQTEQGFLLRGDQRLYSPSTVKLNGREIETVLRALSVPVLSIWASDGLVKRDWAADAMALAETVISDLTSVTVDGHHHFHMETVPAEAIAGFTCAWALPIARIVQPPAFVGGTGKGDLTMAAAVSLTFPDGSVKKFDAGTTGRDVAESISKSLAKKAVAVAHRRRSARPCRSGTDGAIEIVTRDDPRALELIRHDAAHVMAEAVQELWPGTQVTIGPVIENGFYYDFKRVHPDTREDWPFTPDDLPLIEKKMREIIQRNAPFTKEIWTREKAKDVFRRHGRGLQGGTGGRDPGRPGPSHLQARRVV